MTHRLLIAWLAVFLVFGIWPGLDLWVSNLFYSARTGSFPLAQSWLLEVIRNLIWNAANLALVVALVFGAFALFATRETAVPGRVWSFVLLLILLGPLLLVNGVLKAYWGRARPADTDEFGGSLPFSAPWEIAGNCTDNCSFVSGEAAAVSCLVIILALVFWHSVSNKRRFVILLASLLVVGAGMRVFKGRHYLSDVIWSVLLMSTLAHVLAMRLGIYESAGRISWTALRTDAGRIATSLRRFWRWS